MSHSSLDDFLTAELEASARRNWDGNLRPFVPELPAWDDVLAELRRLLPNFFPGLIDRGFGDGHLHIYWLLPITEREHDYKVQNGADALEEVFETKGLEYWKTKRKSVI